MRDLGSSYNWTYDMIQANTEDFTNMSTAGHCLHGPPCVAIMVGRWGSWPSWTPFLLRTMAINSRFTFMVLSDTRPAEKLPANVIYREYSLLDLTERLQQTVGLNLSSLPVSRRFRASVPQFNGAEFSAAKTNDLKPMWGEAFASDWLRGYDWWGYMQEDVLLGDLSMCLSTEVLHNYDVITPYDFPFNSSGVLMLLRNTPYVNSLWRRSKDAQRVISDAYYFVFDEWWGASSDHFPAVIGREVEAGRLRLRVGHWSGAESIWYAHDLGVGYAVAVCWWRGRLTVNERFEWTANRIDCFGQMPSVTREFCLYHIVSSKMAPGIKQLALSQPEQRSIQLASEFVLTANGVFIGDAQPDADEFEHRAPLPNGTRLALAERADVGAATRLPAAGWFERPEANQAAPSNYTYVSGREIWRNISRRQALRYLSRLDMCDDIAEQSYVARDLQLHRNRIFTWCWRMRSAGKGHCRQNLTVQALCVRTCVLCPPLNEKVIKIYPEHTAPFIGSRSLYALEQAAAYRDCGQVARRYAENRSLSAELNETNVSACAHQRFYGRRFGHGQSHVG